MVKKKSFERSKGSRVAFAVAGLLVVVLAVWLVPAYFDQLYGPPIQSYSLVPQDTNPWAFPTWWPMMWLGMLTFQTPLMGTILIVVQGILLAVGAALIVYGLKKH